AVVGELGLAAEGGARGDVDDLPAAVRAHRAHGQEGGVRRAEDVDVEGAPPAALPGVVVVAVEKVDLEGGGVVDEDVDAAEAVDHLGDLPRIGHVGAEGDGVADLRGHGPRLR